MNENISRKELIVAFLLALSPTFYTAWNDDQKTITDVLAKHEVKLENHALRIQANEKRYSDVTNQFKDLDDKIDEQSRMLTKILVALEKKEDRD